MTMSPALQVILSACLSFGVPLLIAIYELRSLRRYRGGGGGWQTPSPRTPPRPTQGGFRPLPTCLVPTAQWRAPSPTPVRVREPA